MNTSRMLPAYGLIAAIGLTAAWAVTSGEGTAFLWPSADDPDTSPAAIQDRLDVLHEIGEQRREVARAVVEGKMSESEALVHFRGLQEQAEALDLGVELSEAELVELLRRWVRSIQGLEPVPPSEERPYPGKWRAPRRGPRWQS